MYGVVGVSEVVHTVAKGGGRQKGAGAGRAISDPQTVQPAHHLSSAFFLR